MENRVKILCFIYIPVSFFCILAPMASDGTIGSNDPVYITLINIFCSISWLIPLLCIVGTILHHVFLRRERVVLANTVQLFPLILFVCNLILLAVAESMP